ncbi:MAG: PIG-L family deacetylase [Alphaproteobacteria bacterium]|nr:PIG-L family deacetylase [Alphaproteobacteria bacterium]
MPTQDQIRITNDRARPRIMELWWALRPLTSVIRFMNTGAHPDDETSAMLAAMAFRDGINLSYACSTRGEGGQNDIGTEAGADLGTLRTREMERACDVLGMRMYWHSESPDDPITDFGFSKSGVETLGKWGHDRTLARFVEIIRTDKPDIICPTFLDISGQHGHHRAMTQAAHEVMAAAADPGFPSNLAPWQVKKLYLPAWSGAGQAYDDDEPPPPATLTVEASGRDAVSGWSWERIGQQSRAYHRTQGMGRWVPAGPGRDWPLHLSEAHVDGPDEALSSGLPATVGDLADLDGAGPIAGLLREAQSLIEAAVACYPTFSAVAQNAAEASVLVTRAIAECPEAVREDILHRLKAKQTQLAHVLRLALGVDARARTKDLWVHPGDATDVVVELDPGEAMAVETAFDLPQGWDQDGEAIRLGENAALTAPYRTAYDPLDPPAPALLVNIETGEAKVQARLPFEAPPVALPARLADITPERAILNTAHSSRSVSVTLANVRPAGADAQITVPDGWNAARTDTGFDLTLPEDAAEGLYHLPLDIDGAPAMRVRRIAYDHVDATARAYPATVNLRVLNVAVPQARIGYIGSGNDRVGHWLAAIDADVRDVSDPELQSDASLAQYDTLVIGIFALRFRPGLAEVMPRLHRWTENGGTLVTLYHRPWDNWDAERTAPRPLEIGQPSLRWRVTDESAEVGHLTDHPVLQGPNPIGPGTWDGWVKERGLYFAKRWDAAYQPLLEMADPDEAPHQGALLVADIGAGRHVHTSLILHHQMEHLLPGAFHLMANLIAPRR